jgi:hypothetical protein
MFMADLSLVKYSGRFLGKVDKLQYDFGLGTVFFRSRVRDGIQLRILPSPIQETTIDVLYSLRQCPSNAGVDYKPWPLQVELQTLSEVDSNQELPAKDVDD